jgi:GH35 family endo-1,4-beta-xylanase
MSKSGFITALTAIVLAFVHGACLRADAPSLKDAYAKDFLIGTALDFRTPGEFNPAELAIIKSQFNVITPENSMKPASIHPREDTWNWTTAEALVQFCQENHIQTIGHCLVWNQQTGNWFFAGENGQPVTRDVALARLKTHIETEVGHFKGKIKGWDVVNEAINDGGNAATALTENLRNSPWMQAIGPDYPLYAFKYAREADPNADLHYNDYNIETGPKHASSLLLLKRLIAAGASITAVGIQGHWNLNSVPYDAVDKAIDDYKALGLKVMITELDITIPAPGTRGATQAATRATTQATTTGARAARGRAGLAAAPASPDDLKRQADAYARLFAIFQKHKDVITRVTFWGLNDARSWRAGQNPLVFDRQNLPKPALFSIIAAAANPAILPATRP